MNIGFWKALKIAAGTIVAIGAGRAIAVSLGREFPV